MKGFFICIVSLLLTTSTLSQSVNIFVLNKCGHSDIDRVVKILRDLYRFNIILNQSYNFGIANNVIDCDELNMKISGNKVFRYDPKKPINVFVTTHTLMINNNMKVKGVCYGNNVYINSLSKKQLKTTLIHEISHTFGVKHCKDVCIMNIKYNPDYTDLIWNKKTNKPVFCNKCRSMLKNIRMIF